MRKISYFLIILICFLLLSCSTKTKEEQKNVASESISIDSIADDLRSKTVEYSAKAHIKNMTKCDQVTVFSGINADDCSTSLYLTARINDQEYSALVGSFPNACFWDGSLMCADFDGDGEDEILLHTSVNPNMARITRIYKFISDEIIQIQNLDKLDLGLYFEPIGNKQIHVYSESMDISFDTDISYFSDEAFDLDGKYINHLDNTVYSSGILSCEKRDSKSIIAKIDLKDNWNNVFCFLNINLVYDDDKGEMVFASVDSIIPFEHQLH